MATLRDIRRRITSVTNTRQITNAMKMVSTAKLSRAQNAVRAAGPYAEVLRRMVISLSGGLTGEDHPFFNRRGDGKTVVILFTSDRGLCGAFNANLSKTLLRAFSTDETLADCELVTMGRKGQEFFVRRGYTPIKVVAQVPEAEKAALIPSVLKEQIDRFLQGEIGGITLVYNEFKSAIGQEPRIVPLLPIEPPTVEEAQAEEGPAVDDRESLFEPSLNEVLNQLLPDYLENQCFMAHLHNEAGEQGARMVAMDGATRNAGEMISSLTLQANKVRQAAITKELIEIVNGAEAL